MGKEIVYCSGCGKIIREEDFARGKAGTHDARPYCSGCRPVQAPPPRAAAKPAPARAPAPPPVEAPAPRPMRTRLLLGGGAAAALVLASVLVLVFAGGSPPPPAPPPDPGAALLAGIDPAADPETVLRRCAEARPRLAGTPHEAALRRIEAAARQAKAERDRDAKLEAILETARRLQADDPEFRKKDGVLALFESALEAAGPRRDEVQALRDLYERKSKEAALAAAPAPAPPPPPPPAPAEPNRPPQVSITGLEEGARFAAPAEIRIAAAAVDPDGRIAKVEFLAGPLRIGEAVEPPYECVWRNVSQAGSYALTARATDDAGAETVSAAVTVMVTAERKRAPFGGVALALPGRIQAEDFDRGDEGVAYHDLDPENRGGKYRESGVDIEAAQDADGVFCVSSTRAGEWLEYGVEVAEAGTYSIEVRVSSSGAGGVFHLEFTGVDKTGPLPVPDTRGAWAAVRKGGVRLEAGEQILRLVIDKEGAAGSAGSFNFIAVAKDVAAPPPPPKPVAKKPAKPDPFLLKVEEAIRKGTEYLKARPDIHPQYKELVMLTYLHAGVPEKDPEFQPLLKSALAFTNDGYSARTYNIALLAMVLEELDRVGYQHDLYKCAQFLVDNEAANGQWGYGAATTYLEKVPTTPAKSVATPGKIKTAPKVQDPYAAWAPRPKPPVRLNIKVKPQRAGPDHGDNSNSQYAALGLRACHDGGIVFPKELVERARKWWVDSQQPADAKKNRPDVPTGAAVGEPRGWAYLSDGKVPSPDYYHPTGSMSAGAVGGICIYDFMLGLNWKGDPSVRDGMAWLSEHFAVTGNPQEEKGKVSPEWHYYWLYALERVGMLYGSAQIGRHDWYGTGAKYLVEKQQADGSWGEGKYHGSAAPVLDTCYAILFLRRVTRPLQDVATVDAR
jgi:hypothetical protein